jgi:hypothetical protein
MRSMAIGQTNVENLLPPERRQNSHDPNRKYYRQPPIMSSNLFRLPAVPVRHEDPLVVAILSAQR